jgi:hypothetical protein
MTRYFLIVIMISTALLVSILLVVFFDLPTSNVAMTESVSRSFTEATPLPRISSTLILKGPQPAPRAARDLEWS